MKLGVRDRVGVVVLAWETGFVRPGGLNQAEAATTFAHNRPGWGIRTKTFAEMHGHEAGRPARMTTWCASRSKASAPP